MSESQRWKTVEYSIQQINRAGDVIRSQDVDGTKQQDAIKIIDNWRAAHAYPMHVIYIHLRKISEKRKYDKGELSLVVERLKRLDSIVAKLKREQGMDLCRMQDLGGCRVIVPSLENVWDFANQYKKSRIRHKFKREYDYITRPKNSGYRSLHLVYKFHSDKKETYNKSIFIEIQIRTHLQHLWATALETMGLFTKQALKAGEGDIYVKRFFVLVSSLFAMQEHTPLIPHTPTDKAHLLSEIREIDAKHKILKKLRAVRAAGIHMESIKKSTKSCYYVLQLDYSQNMLKITHFLPSQFQNANQYYTYLEQTPNGIDTVLVRTSSFNELKKAYPNYFSDIGEFITLIHNELKAL